MLVDCVQIDKSKESSEVKQAIPTAELDDMPDEDIIISGARATDISRIVKGLSGCGVSWNMLPSKIRC